MLSAIHAYQLSPYQHLKAVIHADLYMNHIMHPWYYFCFIEAKGLDKEQREAAMNMELQFDQGLQNIFSKGIEAGVFRYEGNLALLASSTTAMLQQWYLKRWKFLQRGVSVSDYAEFTLNLLLNNLSYQSGASR